MFDLIVQYLACNAGDPGSILGLGRCPGEGNSSPLQCSCLEKSHGQRSLAGYGPWGRTESDTTERLTNPCALYSAVQGLALSEEALRVTGWRRAWQPTPVFSPGKIPWTEEPGRLQSIGLQRVRHD